MKAAIISAPRIPLTIEEIDIAKPIDREVLVRTAVSGVCHSDLHYVDRPTFEPCAVLDRSRTPGPPSSRNDTGHRPDHQQQHENTTHDDPFYPSGF